MRFKLSFFVLTVIQLSIVGFASGQETIALHCDRISCRSGDTIYFKGYILWHHGFSKLTTNLFTELRTPDGKLVSQNIFPVLGGQAMGQQIIPDSLVSGLYWLRCYSKIQALAGDPNLTIVPIVINNGIHDWKLKAKSKIHIGSPKVEITPDTLNADPLSFNSIRIHLSDTACTYHYSCAISNADEDSLSYENTVIVPGGTTTSFGYQSEIADTSFLSISGKALQADNKKIITDKSLILLLAKDSTILWQRAVPVGSDGKFRTGKLFFFGQASLMFQLNEKGNDQKNVLLDVDKFQAPAFVKPADYVLADADTSEKAIALKRSVNFQDTNATGIKLKEVKIKGWKSPRKELDHTYTSGAFSEPALRSFDLRDEREFDLGSYLRAHVPGFEGGYSAMDTPMYMRKKDRLIFYVDEQVTTWQEIDKNLTDVAYIKAFKSDFIGNDPYTKWLTGVSDFTLAGGDPTPMIISIYTRKGKDIKPIPGLNSIAVTGYTPIATFDPINTNRSTLAWVPLIDQNDVRIRFFNTETAERFRVTIFGYSDKGTGLYYTKIISKTDAK